MHIRYIYDILYVIFPNHFTFFLINIGALYTFFQRVCATFTHFSRQFYAEWCIMHDMFTIHLPIFDVLNHILLRQHLAPYHIFVPLIFYASFNITL